MNSELVKRILRVNHAGEFGAKQIYQGQLDFIKDDSARAKIKEMQEQELEHLNYFSAELDKRNLKPTILQPLWQVAGYGLGAVSALLGEKVAMATTIAVEEVIVEHYQKQIDQLDESEAELKEKIIKFQADEEEHKNTGVENHGMSALCYDQGSKIIKCGSKIAIWLSERF